MKTQISRDGYRADKRYSGVYQQQGRMITDRDWNELVDILKTRVDEGFADVVGNGVPRGRAVNLSKDSQGALAIQPGLVYAGGMAGQIAPAPGIAIPFKYDQQADFPTPPPLPSGQAYVLYADLWDRPVLALEDDGLRDPGLNGADTTTRTQTMAQLKWAQTGKDPESATQNPARGNATLAASIPTGTTGDPLNSVNPVGGDYLFRLEVHDVTWSPGAAPDAPSRVVLKWSRENGAEQHKALEAPNSFKTGPWIYELYKLAGEKQLGYHFSTSWSATRGTFSDTFPTLSQQNNQNDFIRRWDGYLVLTRSGSGVWDFSSLSTELPAKTAPGTTPPPSIASGKLTVRLTDFELALDLQGKTFLAGDYWLVPVRRAVHAPGTQIVQNALPTGIQHRYATLANVAANGDVTPKMVPFPALNKIEAGDVRYDGSGCTSGLFNSTHDNVKKALDRLWQLAAPHVAYTKANDAHVYSGQTVTTAAQALDVLGKLKTEQIAYTAGTSPRGLFDTTHTTVKKALDRLGADLAAGHVAYAKESDAPVFTGKTINTVTDALNTLGKVGAGQVGYDRTGYATVKAGLDELFSRPNYTTQDVAVGPGGQYTTLAIAIQTMTAAGKKDIRLRLLPGSHEIAGTYSYPGVQITVLGVRSAAPVRLLGPVTFSGLAAFRLSGVTLWPEPQNGNPTLSVQDCAEVVIDDCYIEGMALIAPLVQIQRASRIEFRRNQVIAPTSITADNTTSLIFQQLDPNFPQVFTATTVDAFRSGAMTIFQSLQTLKATSLQVYNLRQQQTRNYITWNIFNADDRIPYIAVCDAVDNNNSASYLQNLELIRKKTQVRQPGLALAFHDAQANVWLEDSQIYGFVSLYGISNLIDDLNRSQMDNIQNRLQQNQQTDPLQGQGTEFHAANNVITGFRIAPLMLQQLAGMGWSTVITNVFRRLTLTNNSIEGLRNQWLAYLVHMNSTAFWTQPVNNYDPIRGGWVCGLRVFAVSNIWENPQDQNSTLLYQLTTLTRQRQEATNVGLNFNLPDYSY